MIMAKRSIFRANLLGLRLFWNCSKKYEWSLTKQETRWGFLSSWLQPWLSNGIQSKSRSKAIQPFSNASMTCSNEKEGNGVIEKLLENWLDSASERSYQAVFVQMLSAQGYRVMHSTRHTALEFGKDVIAVDPEGVWCAYQLKGTPGGKLGLSEFRAQIQPQLVQLMSQPIVFPGFHGGGHRSYLVNNGEYQEEVIRAVDDLNRNSAYPSKVTLIARGNMLRWCKEFGVALWPSELEDTKALLELFLSDPRDILPAEKLSILLEQILRLRKEDEGPIGAPEFERRVTSAALLTGIATSPFGEAGNHLAMISAWALFAISVIASVEKNSHRLKGAIERTLALAEAAIGEALALMWQEVQENSILVEGNALAEPEVRGWRITTLMGILSTLAFLDEEKKCLQPESMEKLCEWLKQPPGGCTIWGEAASAPLAIWIYWLLSHGEQEKAKTELKALASVVIARNAPKSMEALATPYYTWPEVLAKGVGPEFQGWSPAMGREGFAGNSYTAEAIYHMLVRLDQKQECQELWRLFSIMAHHVCLHDEPYQFCLLRMPTGINQTRIYPESYTWLDLQTEARAASPGFFPAYLLARPWLMALWWQVAPFRFTSASSVLLATSLNV
jgi:hypothetical protein